MRTQHLQRRVTDSRSISLAAGCTSLWVPALAFPTPLFAGQCRQMGVGAVVRRSAHRRGGRRTSLHTVCPPVAPSSSCCTSYQRFVAAHGLKIWHKPLCPWAVFGSGNCSSSSQQLAADACWRPCLTESCYLKLSAAPARQVWCAENYIEVPNVSSLLTASCPCWLAVAVQQPAESYAGRQRQRSTTQYDGDVSSCTNMGI